MSGESSSRGSTTYFNTSTLPAPQRMSVTAQPITDKTFMDSVTGFLNDVVPNSYTTNVSMNESKEQIIWARFEYSDITDPSFFGQEEDTSIPPPLLLVLGYQYGAQVWTISPTGDATEVLSWRQGSVRILRFLPTPFSTAHKIVNDSFANKRPLVALCSASNDISPNAALVPFSTLNFISLKDGDQVKSICFKNPILDILANRDSIVCTFNERIAVFDACTLEDCLTVTTCYLSPGLFPNPVALGDQWLAYAEKNLIPSWRSNGGCDCEGVPSYTASVLQAAKSLGKGLRGLGGSVASSLTGSSTNLSSPQINIGLGSANESSGPTQPQPGIVTIIDIMKNRNDSKSEDVKRRSFNVADHVIAHFQAHSEAIVAMSFDPSGLLLLTVDKRGHDFHLFKIQAHALHSSSAQVHHLYTLHRGDTTAKVQDIAFSWDSRWVAVSTLRGTTHVFPITPYGGPIGVRTHATAHVVNRLSRFHRSAGLDDETVTSGSQARRSSSPSDSSGSGSSPTMLTILNMNARGTHWSSYPHPNIIYPFAQVRQPSNQFGPGNISFQTNVKSSVSQRQRLTSTSEETPNMKLCAIFAHPRAQTIPTLNCGEARHTFSARNISNQSQSKSIVDSLFIIACHGSLVQYDLDPRSALNVPKEKVCDETTIELQVTAKVRWQLVRGHSWPEVPLQLLKMNDPHPLLLENIKKIIWERKYGGEYDSSCTGAISPTSSTSSGFVDDDNTDDRWLSQVEIITHVGPHRRLWMGPQFVFKTYNLQTSGDQDQSNIATIDLESIELNSVMSTRSQRSNPVDIISNSIIPIADVKSSSSLLSDVKCSVTTTNSVPVFFESSSLGDSDSSSPSNISRLLNKNVSGCISAGDLQLKEDLADAMIESNNDDSIPFQSAKQTVPGESKKHQLSPASTFGPPFAQRRCCSAQSSFSVTPNIDVSSKVINPVGTITTLLQNQPKSIIDSADMFVNVDLEEKQSLYADSYDFCMISPNLLKNVDVSSSNDDNEIFENYDESLFRPIVAAPLKLSTEFSTENELNFTSVPTMPAPFCVIELKTNEKIVDKPVELIDDDDDDLKLKETDEKLIDLIDRTENDDLEIEAFDGECLLSPKVECFDEKKQEELRVEREESVESMYIEPYVLDIEKILIDACEEKNGEVLEGKSEEEEEDETKKKSSKKKKYENDMKNLEVIDVKTNVVVVSSSGAAKVKRNKKSNKNIIEISTEDSSNEDVAKDELKKTKKKKSEELNDVKLASDTDLDFCEAKNCGLELGKSCYPKAEVEKSTKSGKTRRSKKNKNKKIDDEKLGVVDVIVPDPREIIINNQSSASDGDEFLSLDPDVIEDISVVPDKLNGEKQMADQLLISGACIVPEDTQITSECSEVKIEEELNSFSKKTFSDCFLQAKDELENEELEIKSLMDPSSEKNSELNGAKVFDDVKIDECCLVGSDLVSANTESSNIGERKGNKNKKSKFSQKMRSKRL